MRSQCREIYTKIGKEDALSYLKSKVKEGSAGLSKVFSKIELIKRYGPFCEFSIMVEGDRRIMFSNKIGTGICKDSNEASTFLKAMYIDSNGLEEPLDILIYHKTL